MKRQLALALAIIFGLVVFSCGREAKKAIDDAQLALNQAKEAGAEQYAPSEYKSAEELLAKARKQFDERDYKEAKASALSAKDQALLAKKRAEERKKEAEKAEEEVSTAYNVPSLSEEGVPIEEQAKAALKDIHFGFDRYDLTEEAKKILEENARWLKEHPEVKIIIEGHCDERGSEEYNLVLGEKRAKAARDYLISLGIDPSRLSIISYGESMPLDPRHCEEAWAKNRRAHFAIQK